MMKIRYTIIILLFLGLFSPVEAQQRPQLSQYMVNNFLLNPAVAGAYDYLDIRAGFRNQWTSLDGAPQTFFVTAHGAPRPRVGALPTIGTEDYGSIIRNGKTGLNVRHGVGGMILYDKTGASNRLMLYGNYALHVPITKTLTASLGVQLGLINSRQNNDNLIPLVNPDPGLEDGVFNSLVPDLGIGAMVYSDKYYIGFSLSQVLQSELSFSDVNSGPQNKLFIHYYLSGGYRFDISDRVHFIPSALIKFLQASPASVDFNARFAFDLGGKKGNTNHIWVGASYRYDDAFAGLVGFSISRWIDL
ncbi:MAG: type IX secretion system membrane protein PorP/SprF, partial [Bacteroidota bacterium]